MNNNNKKAQVTIFIIIAILIIIVLIILLWPRIKPIFLPSVFSPDTEFSNCIKEDFENTIETVSLQGGSISPNLYLDYKKNNVEYLCYNEEFYQTCVVQRPLLKQHIEKEISDSISSKVNECFENIKQEASRQGFNVESGLESIEVEISRNNIDLNVLVNLILEKDEGRILYEKLNINKQSGLYVLIIHSLTIIDWETRFGDFDSMSFMLQYPDVKLEKYRIDEGDKIYILTDRDTQENFTFATRSLAFPAGYGIDF